MHESDALYKGSQPWRGKNGLLITRIERFLKFTSSDWSLCLHVIHYSEYAEKSMSTIVENTQNHCRCSREANYRWYGLLASQYSSSHNYLRFSQHASSLTGFNSRLHIYEMWSTYQKYLFIACQILPYLRMDPKDSRVYTQIVPLINICRVVMQDTCTNCLCTGFASMYSLQGPQLIQMELNKQRHSGFPVRWFPRRLWKLSSPHVSTKHLADDSETQKNEHLSDC